MGEKREETGIGLRGGGKEEKATNEGGHVHSGTAKGEKS